MDQLSINNALRSGTHGMREIRVVYSNAIEGKDISTCTLPPHPRLHACVSGVLCYLVPPNGMSAQCARGFVDQQSAGIPAFLILQIELSCQPLCKILQERTPE